MPFREFVTLRPTTRRLCVGSFHLEKKTIRNLNMFLQRFGKYGFFSLAYVFHAQDYCARL